jgi:uncharacterized protein YkwD
LATPRARLGVETLEVRDCPAYASLYNGVLTVQGTEGNDKILISRSGDQIAAAGQWFAVGSIGLLVVSAGSGNDAIRDDSGLSAVIYAGAGNDRIIGGRGHDTIYGSQGDDTIFGKRGRDLIWGGSGTDRIDGGLGENSIDWGSAYLAEGNTTLETEIVKLVNAYRRANGVAPLTVNAQLNAAADLHSRDMIAIGDLYGPWTAMQHQLFGTARPHISDRLDAVGYDEWTRALRYSENIAYGFTTAADVVGVWMASAPHRANILSPAYTETGVSVRTDAAGRHYFTQDFGFLA